MTLLSIPNAKTHRNYLLSKRHIFKEKLINAIKREFEVAYDNNIAASSITIDIEVVLDGFFPYNCKNHDTVNELLSPDTPSGNEVVYQKINPDSFMKEVIEYIMSLGYNIVLEGSHMNIRLKDTKL